MHGVLKKLPLVVHVVIWDDILSISMVFVIRHYEDPVMNQK